MVHPIIFVFIKWYQSGKDFLRRGRRGAKKKEVQFVEEGEKIAANLEQECSIVTRGENQRDAKRLSSREELGKVSCSREDFLL